MYIFFISLFFVFSFLLLWLPSSLAGLLFQVPLEIYSRSPVSFQRITVSTVLFFLNELVFNGGTITSLVIIQFYFVPYKPFIFGVLLLSAGLECLYVGELVLTPSSLFSRFLRVIGNRSSAVQSEERSHVP